MKVVTPGSRSQPAIKAWATRKSNEYQASRRARQAWTTRNSARYRASKSEKGSKEALTRWCAENGWRVVFFEGPTGAPRTGIVDAIITRIKPRNRDLIEIRLVQLKAGLGGLTGEEITRLKAAASNISVDWLLAAHDKDTLHLVPDIPAQGASDL